MKTFTLLSWILCISLLVLSCRSPNKLLQKQKYDEAIEKVIKRVRKGKAIDVEWRAALEQAFAKRIRRDMKQIARLKRKARLGDWDRVYQIASDIESLQDMIDPYLPIYDTDGSPAQFSFVITEPILQEAAQRSVQQYYAAIQDVLSAAKKGDKQKARKALFYIAKIGRYDENYRDIHKLGILLEELALTKISFKLENRAGVFLPAVLASALDGFYPDEPLDPWIVIDPLPIEKRQYDYEISYQITEIDVSPEHFEQTVIDEIKELETIEYKKDACGNYILDSLGQKIEIVLVEVVRARVLKVFQTKEAFMNGILEVRDLNYNRWILSEPVQSVSVFEKESCTFEGDERALSDNVRITGPPVDFPSDETMMLQLIDRLKPAIGDRIGQLDLANTSYQSAAYTLED